MYLGALLLSEPLWRTPTIGANPHPNEGSRNRGRPEESCECRKERESVRCCLSARRLATAGKRFSRHRPMAMDGIGQFNIEAASLKNAIRINFAFDSLAKKVLTKHVDYPGGSPDGAVAGNPDASRPSRVSIAESASSPVASTVICEP